MLESLGSQGEAALERICRPPRRMVQEAFAKEYHMDVKQVMSVLRRLNEDQVLLVCWRFRFDFQREDPLVKLRSFVYSCQKNGFWETKKIDFKEKPSFCALLARAARLAEVAGREGGALHKQPPPPPPPPGAAAASSSSDWRPSIGRTPPPPEPSWNGWQAPEESLPKKMPPPAPPPPVKETSRSSSHAAEESLPKKMPPPTPPPPVKEKAPPFSASAPPPKSELTPKAPPAGWLPTGAAGPGELPKKAPPQPPPAPKPCLDEKEVFSAPSPPPSKPSPAESKASSQPEPDAASSEPTASATAPPEDGLKVGMNVRIAEGKIKGQGVVVNLCGTKAKVKRRSGGLVQEVNRSSLRPVKASDEPPGEEQTSEEAKAGSKKLREIRGPAAGAAGDLQRAIAEVLSAQLKTPAFRDIATCNPKMKEPAKAVPKESATPSVPVQGSAAAPPQPAPSADELPEPLKKRLAEAEAREKALLQRIALLEKDNMEMAARERDFRDVEVELRKRESGLSARVDELLAEQEDLEATVAEMRTREARAAARLDELTREQSEAKALLARVKDAEERLLQERARHREVEDDLGKRLDWATERLHAWQSEGTSPGGVRKGRWGRDQKEEDHVHSSPDSAAASTKTGNSLPAEDSNNDWVEDGLKRLKKCINDLLYEEVRCFAERWDMPIDQVMEVFERLTTEQQKLVMRRFKASPHKGPKIVLLKSYVGSCIHNGFTKQTWDDIKDFSHKWGIPSSDAQDILGDLEDEQLTIITQRFHYDERTANQSTVSAQLRTYVSSCRHRGFYAADKKVHCCEKISNSWRLPLDTVRELLQPLHLEQCDQIASDWRTDPRTEQDGWRERGRSGWHDWRE
ncbi:PDC1 [Symbiodinium sp. CCMP2592]|nr:PDC1 [Symbiodinium sp. CCMP2592]